MGKLKGGKRNSAATSSPYEKAAKQTNNVFKFNTNVGQHILKNPGVAEAIVQKADLKPSDVVLEVGPGTGNLTVRILEKARKVIAVELDPRMAAEVTKRVQGTPMQKRLDVMLGDVIKTELPRSTFAFPIHHIRFVACPPYVPELPMLTIPQISSPLVFKLLSLPNPPRTSILMFQREFALRLTARPGDALYCRLSVNAQFWARITHIMKVGKNNFKPPPQVESSVVRIEPKTGSDRPGVSWEEWDGMLRVCFVRKNRLMRASWSGKEVLALVERNYRVWCAMNDVPLEEGVVEGEDEEMDIEDAGPAQEEWDGIMDVDGDVDGVADDAAEDDNTPSFFKELATQSPAAPQKTKSKRPKTRVAALVRSKIMRVLEETELADRRAAKCDENDFLRLLAGFNAEGLHFA
ncbi:Dimethyladenosine transferase [Pseudogymnoascus australis]